MDALLVASVEGMIQVNQQNAGLSHNVKVVNTFGNVTKFRYLGMILPAENLIHNEVNSTLNLGKASYHSVQPSLSSDLLSKIQCNIFRTLILPVFLWI